MHDGSTPGFRWGQREEPRFPTAAVPCVAQGSAESCPCTGSRKPLVLGSRGKIFVREGGESRITVGNSWLPAMWGFPPKVQPHAEQPRNMPTDTSALLKVPVHSLCLQEVLSPFLTSGDAPWESHPPQPPGLLRGLHSGPDSSTKW